MYPKYIIIHCSDSGFGNTMEIDKWHKERGFDKVGYHYVICNGKDEPALYVMSKDGAIESGRKTHEQGAHCIGYNDKSIGICLIGVNEFTESQKDSLKALTTELMDSYNIPKENVLGHYETEHAQGKTCPNINMDEFRQGILSA